MGKYLFSRFMLVFLVSFFISWAFHTNQQLEYFFGIETTVSLKGVYLLLTVIIILLGLITITGVFALLNLNYDSELIESINKKGFKGCIKYFFKNFFGIFSELFNTEFYYDLYPKQFLVFAIVFFTFFKGNPLVNNYHGITKESQIEGQGMYANESHSDEIHDYIMSDSEISSINNRMSELEGEISDDDPFFIVKKRGYLFMQSGLIDGYKSPNFEYIGFFSYLECLLFLAIEKFINSIIFFFFPFLISIGIYQYNDLKKKKIGPIKF